MANINWTAEGERWLKEIYAYIAQDRPDSAINIVEAICEKVELLRTFPYLGSRYEPESANDIRILLYGHYRIAYLVKSDEDIDILGIFHTALNIERYL